MPNVKLYVQAPFAVFRRFSAGSFRPSASFMTPTAAYGLLLNLAGIESRRDDGKSPMTLTRDDLPHMRIALGIPKLEQEAPNFPTSSSVFQQLHKYPRNAGREHAPNTKGTKYGISPVRREFLHDFKATIAAECPTDVAQEINAAIAGKSTRPRYGIPFLGDNSFLVDVLTNDERADAPVWWLEAVTEHDQADIDADLVTRLTTFIDRADSSKSRSHLFAPSNEATTVPPEKAWSVLGAE